MKSLTEIPGDSEFFREFARFEYALKEAGYFYVGRYGEARTAWSRFQNEMAQRQDLFDCANRDPEIKYLIDLPPECRVVVKDGVFDWQPLPEIKNMRDLVKAVERVRNNLFHGDKSGPPSEANDPDRNRKLIRAGRRVLHLIHAHCDELAAKFDAPEPPAHT